eukprot:GHVU01217677.1.p1 GENE.GHVU01217677.1~~GHVU01217677.1.p1  ORF type:complete len:197 (-),score=18.28 GHVU01217677.1:470-1060(-)
MNEMRRNYSERGWRLAVGCPLQELNGTISEDLGMFRFNLSLTKQTSEVIRAEAALKKKPAPRPPLAEKVVRRYDVGMSPTGGEAGKAGRRGDNAGGTGGDEGAGGAGGGAGGRGPEQTVDSEPRTFSYSTYEIHIAEAELARQTGSFVLRPDSRYGNMVIPSLPLWMEAGTRTPPLDGAGGGTDCRHAGAHLENSL